MVVTPKDVRICPNSNCQALLQPNDGRIFAYSKLEFDLESGLNLDSELPLELYETDYPIGGQLFTDGKVGCDKSNYIGFVKCPKCKKIFSEGAGSIFKESFIQKKHLQALWEDALWGNNNKLSYNVNQLEKEILKKYPPLRLIYMKGSQYLRAISKIESISRSSEFLLRLGYWWYENDKWREESYNKTVYEPFVNEKNLREINKMLDTNKLKDTLLSIEIHRQLGEFDKAWDLIGNHETKFEEFIKKHPVVPKNKYSGYSRSLDVEKHTILFDSYKKFLLNRDVSVKAFPYLNNIDVVIIQ